MKALRILDTVFRVALGGFLLFLVYLVWSIAPLELW